MNDISENLIKAALNLCNNPDANVSLEEAKERIRKYTGFPAEENDIDSSYVRLSWDEYFMSLAFLVAMRSPDAQTQHGAVIVDKNNNLVSTGYNGFLQGSVDSVMPNLRPKKYMHMIHSEANAILSAHQNLEGCKIYVTGPPCNECLKVIARVGIKEIIIGDRLHVFSDGYLELQSLICASHDIEIKKFKGKLAVSDGRTIV